MHYRLRTLMIWAAISIVGVVVFAILGVCFMAALEAARQDAIKNPPRARS